MLQLKAIFPTVRKQKAPSRYLFGCSRVIPCNHQPLFWHAMQADVSAMLNNRLTLLLDDDMDVIQEASEKLRAALPDIDIDRCVTAA